MLKIILLYVIRKKKRIIKFWEKVAVMNITFPWKIHFDVVVQLVHRAFYFNSLDGYYSETFQYGASPIVNMP